MRPSLSQIAQGDDVRPPRKRGVFDAMPHWQRVAVLRNLSLFADRLADLALAGARSGNSRGLRTSTAFFTGRSFSGESEFLHR